MSKRSKVTPSSGDVYDDLRLPNARDRMLKAQLSRSGNLSSRRVDVIGDRHLLRIDQPKVSYFMCGWLSGFSVVRLFDILNRLGHNIEVHISKEEYAVEETYTAVVA